MTVANTLKGLAFDVGGAEAGNLAADRLAANVGLIDDRSQCISAKRNLRRRPDYGTVAK